MRVWLEHRGLTQQAVADAAGVGKSYVYQREAGTNAGVVGTLRALAAALEIELDDLEPWTKTGDRGRSRRSGARGIGPSARHRAQTQTTTAV